MLPPNSHQPSILIYFSTCVCRSIKLLECGDEDERSAQLFHSQLKASIMEIDW
jgi:hypothetical protein